jgi:hypothetical protein
MIVDSLLGCLIESVIDFHYRGLVPASVTIVGRGKDGNNTAIMLPLITFHDQLVCACDEVKSIDVSELLSDILTKRVPSPPRRDTPATATKRTKTNSKRPKVEKPHRGATE